MRTVYSTIGTTGVSALLSLALATGPVMAQQSQKTTEAQDSEVQKSQDAPGQEMSAASKGSAGSQEADALIATVGDAEIRGSDVMEVIGQLPQQTRQQPAELLIPFAVEQLILRQLILQQARSENLAEDPDVIAMVEESAGTAEEDAMVRVWLQREMEGVVTDEAVQQTYDQLQQNSDTELPPLQAVRPQIEQQLRQRAVQDIRTDLGTGIDVVFYGPGGEPVEATTDPDAQSGASAQAEDGDQEGSASADE